MSEIVQLQKIEEDAIRTANIGADRDAEIKKWPVHVHHEWLNCYYKQMERNEKANQAA